MGQAVECDAVVVGAGPAGSATANLLASNGHRVIAVDRARFPRPKACAEYVSPGAVAILEQLGALAALAPGTGRRLDGMHIRAPRGGCYSVRYQVDGRPRQAFSISRTDLDLALVQTARDRGATIWEGFRATELLRDGSTVRGVAGVDASGNQTMVRARLVVGADGPHSMVAAGLGLSRVVRWPRRLGLVAHVAGVRWPEGMGQMWVGRNGYLGAAPVADDVVSVGLVRPIPRCTLGAASTALEAGLREYPELASRLSAGERVGPVRGMGPLAHAVRRTAGPGFLLVGDAAGFLDPFTGEGIYRAVRGAQIAAEVAGPGLSRGQGPVDVSASYERARRSVFAPKERLTWLIQAFVHAPALMDYAVARLAARADLGARLANVLGDLAPAAPILQPAFLAPLLRP